MKQQGVLLLPLDEVLVHHRVPSMKRLGILVLPPGWDAGPSQGTQHEATRNVTIPPEWDASPSQGTSIKRIGRYYYSPPGRDASPLQGTQHEATTSITAPPGWNAFQ